MKKFSLLPLTSCLLFRTQLCSLFLLCCAPLFAQNHIAAKPKIYALVVGVSKYQDQSIKSLEFADKDAIAFANFLKSPNAGQVAEQNLILLTNEQATRVAVVEALKDLILRTTPEDLLIFYFSGHGQTGELEHTGYLLSSETIYTKRTSTAISMSEVKNMIRDCPAKMKVSFIDACHAGMFQDKGKGGSDNNREIVDAYMSGLASADPENITFMSSSSTQESGEDPDLKHGIFSYFLLKGLKGEADLIQQGAPGYNNGIVSVGEMDTYLNEKIPAASHYKQKPIVSGINDPEFPLCVVHNGMNLSNEISRRPAAPPKKETPVVLTAPVSAAPPPDETLPTGMAFTQGVCYCQAVFMNHTKYTVSLAGYVNTRMSGYMIADIKIIPGASGATSRIVLARNFGIGNCKGLVGDYVFYFQREEGDGWNMPPFRHPWNTV